MQNNIWQACEKSVIVYVGPSRMSKLLNQAVSRMTVDIRDDLKLARRLVIGMNCWSKKSLTASFLGISASFFHPSSHIFIHVLLNLHQIAHPHTGDKLAEKQVETMESWGINRSKVLLVVTDNGSNIVKAVRVADEFHEQTDDEEKDTVQNEHEYEKEIESDSDSDSDDDDDHESNSESECEDIYESLEEYFFLPKFPCIAHTLQSVIKELSQSQAYCNLITKVRSWLSL